MKPHLYSFPTMYNTWGLGIQESTEKNGRTRKNASLSSNFLAVFLDHRSSGDSRDLFCTVNLTLMSLQCEGLVFSWKMSHWEACIGQISLRFKNFHLPTENSKIRFWAWHSIFFNLFVHGTILAYTNKK